MRSQRRFAHTNVEVRHGEATARRFDDASFDSAASFTMLHHVRTRVLQSLLAEVLRVLRPCTLRLPQRQPMPGTRTSGAPPAGTASRTL
jgi:ubiquinone/menaquinone biosynthesis C-methylase UbiE